MSLFPASLRPLLCAGLLCFCAAHARAQEKPAAPPTNPTSPAEANKKDPQSSFEPRSGPGAGQKLMEKMVGEWEVTKSIFPVGKPPIRTHGTCHQMMVNEGRFLHSQFEFDDPATGGKNVGVGILGYDPKTDAFTSVWIDTRSTAFSFRQSDGKFDGEQVILFGKSLETKNPVRVSRSVAHLENNGKLLLHQQFVPAAEGGERVVMELKMVRMDDAPKKSAKPKQASAK